MMLQVYNTLTREKEPFETIEPGKVRMYVCGPTVYDKAHVGHAMFILIFDTIRRYLEYRDYDVKLVMNYTDVDDKIILRAQTEKIDPLELAELYIREFDDHLEAMNILPVTKKPRVSEVIDRIIEMIEGLIAKGYAYPANGDVYFRVDRDDDYGKLSGRKIEDMVAGARVDLNVAKEHPMDFALWKSAKPGEPYWDCPWGQGRPGWHIECSAMNLEYLGEQIDIHGGGNDLIFPHHENEIAQTESLTGKPMARYWMHNGMMQLSGEKMSKSIGNLVTIEAFLDAHSADTLRLMVLNSGYRRPLTYSDATITNAERALDRLHSALRPAQPGKQSPPPEVAEQLQNRAEKTKREFVAAMDDDFNTAAALGTMFELVRAVNHARDAGLDAETLAESQNLILELGRVLGLNFDKKTIKDNEAAPFIELLIEIRAGLRDQKLWALSDQVRDQLAELGVTLEDSKDGTTWRWA